MSPAFQLRVNEYIALVDDTLARNKAVSIRGIEAGTNVLVCDALSFVTDHEQKGRRCDACLRQREGVKKCSGCGSYLYCNASCQRHHWNTSHKLMCKRMNRFEASPVYQNLSLGKYHQKDALLLSQLVSHYFPNEVEFDENVALTSNILEDPVSIFLSLLSRRSGNQMRPPVICPLGKSSGRTTLSPTYIDKLYSRFECNNFIIHSHLNTIGHGIFPLASRLLNHSCLPNAIVTFTYGKEDCAVRMHVKALRKIEEGEEITIPYIDPALEFHLRQDILRTSYGFTCQCEACRWSLTHSLPKDVPISDDLHSALETFVLPNGKIVLPEDPLLQKLPKYLWGVLSNDYMTDLSKNFQDKAHDGPHDEALVWGKRLLALYLIVYPQNYPQIGMHLLEMAKTAWNSIVAAELDLTSARGREVLAEARQFLVSSQRILNVMGLEGDEHDSPYGVVEALKVILDDAIDSTR